MTKHPSQTFKFFPWCVAALSLAAIPAQADSTVTYAGSENFVSTPFEWEVIVSVDEVSGAVSSIAEIFNDTPSGGEINESLLLGPSTSPARDAERSPVDSNPALGGSFVNDNLENRSVSSGLFYGDLDERLRITSSSSVSFELEYVGDQGSTEAEGVICLMPLQLSIFEGGSGVEAASVQYSYVVEVDGNEIYSNAVRLSGTSASSQLTSLAGPLRTDGVFFSNPVDNAFGYDFPGITLNVPLGVTFDESSPLEANIRFTTTIEANDNNWGGYAGQQSSSDPSNIFIPISIGSIPEPQSAVYLALGAAMMLRRKR